MFTQTSEAYDPTQKYLFDKTKKIVEALNKQLIDTSCAHIGIYFGKYKHRDKGQRLFFPTYDQETLNTIFSVPHLSLYFDTFVNHILENFFSEKNIELEHSETNAHIFFNQVHKLINYYFTAIEENIYWKEFWSRQQELMKTDPNINYEKTEHKILHFVRGSFCFRILLKWYNWVIELKDNDVRYKQITDLISKQFLSPTFEIFYQKCSAYMNENIMELLTEIIRKEQGKDKDIKKDIDLKNIKELRSCFIYHLLQPNSEDFIQKKASEISGIAEAIIANSIQSSPITSEGLDSPSKNVESSSSSFKQKKKSMQYPKLKVEAIERKLEKPSNSLSRRTSRTSRGSEESSSSSTFETCEVLFFKEKRSKPIKIKTIPQPGVVLNRACFFLVVSVEEILKKEKSQQTFSRF